MRKPFTNQIEQFGIEVKSLREANSMTQQELAELCEVDIRTIQRIEGGKHGLGLPLVLALASAFKLSPSELLMNIKL